MWTSKVTLPLLCGVQFLVVLDATIVAIALPDIRTALGFPSAAALQWVISAYTLTFGGLLVAAGRLGDLAGRRRLFVAGVSGFGAASLACALAPSPAVLVAARAAQGVAAAVLTPAALALLTAAFPRSEERRRAVGWWTAAAAGGGASGWVLGGVLVEVLGWPAVFLVNVPLCAAGAVAGARALPRGEPSDRRGGVRGLDLRGAITVTCGLSLLVLALTRIEAAGPGDPLALGTLAAAVAALALFARIERSAAAPILPPWMLRRPAFATAAGAAAVLTATTTPAMFLAILYQQDALGRRPLEAGLWCVPFNLAVIAGSLLGPRLRLPAYVAMSGGLVLVAAGAATLAARTPAALPAGFLLMGLGLGVAAVASTASGTAALDDGEQGVASGVLNAAAQVGTAVGVALVITLAAATSDRAGLAAAAALAVLAALAVTNRRVRRTTPA